MADIWNSPDMNFWEDEKEELNEEDVIIEDDYLNTDEEEEQENNTFLQDFILPEEEENETEASLKQDDYLSTWVPSKPKQSNKTAEYATDYLTNKGIPQHVAAGIVGNLVKESNLNPTISEKGNTRNGRGIAQWDVRNRWKDLQTYAKQSNKSHTDLDTQLDFVLHEAQQRGDLQKTMQAKSPEEAAIIFGKTYERPNEKYADWGSRQAYARGLSKKQSGGYVNNIPKDISNESIYEYLEDETTPDMEFDELSTPNNNIMGGISTGVETINKGISTYDKWKENIGKIGNNIAKTTSGIIDLQTEIAGNQQNQLSLRKFNERRNRKKYQINPRTNNSPLIYT